MEKIAAALSITPPTLRKNYFRELKVREEARARVEAKLIGILMSEAEAGNAGAVEKYFKRLEMADQRDMANIIANRGPAKQPQQKLGKKEARKQNAAEVTGRYAPPTAPILIN